MQDPDREVVYLCEDRLAAALAQGVSVRSGAAVLDPEPDHRFTTLAEVSLFCTLTCLELALPPVQVRRRAGDRKSHYSPATPGRQAEIALATWGASRLVVVHELAHHWVAQSEGLVPSHGAEFRARMLALLEHLGLPRTAQSLAHTFESAGLAAAPAGEGGR